MHFFQLIAVLYSGGLTLTENSGPSTVGGKDTMVLYKNNYCPSTNKELQPLVFRSFTLKKEYSALPSCDDLIVCLMKILKIFYSRRKLVRPACHPVGL